MESSITEIETVNHLMLKEMNSMIKLKSGKANMNI